MRYLAIYRECGEIKVEPFAELETAQAFLLNDPPYSRDDYETVAVYDIQTNVVVWSQDVSGNTGGGEYLLKAFMDWTRERTGSPVIATPTPPEIPFITPKMLQDIIADPKPSTGNNLVADLLGKAMAKAGEDLRTA